MAICWLGKKLESVVRTYRKNKGGPGPFPSIRHWSELRGLNLDRLEKLCNGLFPRTNKTVRNDGGGGGDWNGQAYFRDAVNDYFSFWCPWIVMYWKTVLCIIIKVRSVKSELPKSSIVCKIWIEENKSLIWPNALNRTIARWRYLTTESFDVTSHTPHVVDMKCQ